MSLGTRKIQGLGVVGALALALTFGAVTSAAAARQHQAAVPSVTIAVSATTTGAAAAGCSPEIQGDKLALALAQKQRWFPGVKVSLSFEDNQGSAPGAVTSFQTIASSKAIAVVGPCSTVAATAMQQLVDDARIPVVLSTAGTPGLVTPEWAFRGGIPQYYFDGRVMNILKARGVKTLYIIHEDDNQSIVFVYQNVYRRAAAALGLKIVGDYSTTNRTVDYAPAIAQIQQLKPDAIGVMVITQFNLPVLNQLRNAGLSQTVFGQVGMADPAFYGGGAVTHGTIIPTNFDPSFKYASSAAFLQAYRSAYGGSDPGYIIANGYDATLRVLMALRDAGPKKVAALPTAQARALIRTYLLKQKVIHGAQGPLTVTDNGDVRGPAGVFQITDTGAHKLLEIPAVKTKK